MRKRGLRVVRHGYRRVYALPIVRCFAEGERRRRGLSALQSFERRAPRGRADRAQTHSASMDRWRPGWLHRRSASSHLVLARSKRALRRRDGVPTHAVLSIIVHVYIRVNGSRLTTYLAVVVSSRRYIQFLTVWRLYILVRCRGVFRYHSFMVRSCL